MNNLMISSFLCIYIAEKKGERKQRLVQGGYTYEKR